ncbi:GDSL-type esterase/lipase family protein [Fictibacillus phosphorivorans]|uniref:GDSL-type esterase/lipase family protein n=1 Tax=Fictibacillus phosphorivorans TaxID=1221500 RepID=UPI00203D5371|nr:GDSL-type esterase/lipase family protein [Fictibacillus phosphorivorans]MCM3719372.1 GDSL-type esterase/lipase family protein [Fictibacillus phosphorivorans]MCM3776993.1 GDSL-type esterase/lipase family protein [Fictibacillus phosphorivorans]
MKKRVILIVISVFVLLAGVMIVKALSTDEVEATALGDSLAYGLGDADDNGYIGDVQERYEDKLNKKLVVHDYGVPNDTSTDLLKRLSNKEIAETAKNSDFILINIGTNDFIKSTDRLTKFNKKELQTNQKIYRENLNIIIKRVQKKNASKTIYILGIYNPKVKYADMSDVNEAMLDWNRSTIQVTKDHENVAFIRTDDLFVNKNKKDYFADNLHPNEKGYARIGKRVFDTISMNSNYK